MLILRNRDAVPEVFLRQDPRLAVYSSPTLRNFRSDTESKSALTRSSGDVYAHSSLRGTDVEKRVGELKDQGHMVELLVVLRPPLRLLNMN